MMDLLYWIAGGISVLIVALSPVVVYLNVSRRLTPLFIKWGIIPFDYDLDGFSGPEARRAARSALWLTLTMPYQLLRWYVAGWRASCRR